VTAGAYCVCTSVLVEFVKSRSLYSVLAAPVEGIGTGDSKFGLKLSWLASIPGCDRVIPPDPNEEEGESTFPTPWSGSTSRPIGCWFDLGFRGSDAAEIEAFRESVCRISFRLGCQQGWV
jgi:hypothetical protein